MRILKGLQAALIKTSKIQIHILKKKLHLQKTAKTVKQQHRMKWDGHLIMKPFYFSV